MIGLLHRGGAGVSVTDPYPDPAQSRCQRRARPPHAPIREFDPVILLPNHPEFDDKLVVEADIVLDCRDHFSHAAHIRFIQLSVPSPESAHSCCLGPLAPERRALVAVRPPWRERRRLRYNPSVDDEQQRNQLLKPQDRAERAEVRNHGSLVRRVFGRA